MPNHFIRMRMTHPITQITTSPRIKLMNNFFFHKNVSKIPITLVMGGIDTLTSFKYFQECFLLFNILKSVAILLHSLETNILCLIFNILKSVAIFFHSLETNILCLLFNIAESVAILLHSLETNILCLLFNILKSVAILLPQP